MRAVLSGLCAVALTGGLSAPAAGQTARAKDAYERAIALEEHGNAGGALALLWEAAGLAPRDADIQERLGEALERIGALDAAADAYRLALAARPDFRKASNNLILTLVKSGKSTEAIALARALADASPNDPDRLFTLGLAQSEADVDAAIENFRRVLALAPRHTLARYNLALVLKRADRQADAVAELERALAIEPRAEAQYTLGVIYWQQGDLARAVSALRAAVDLDPKSADAQATLGAVLKASRDWDGASASLRRAIALDPARAAPHYTLAQVLELRGDSAGARTERAEADRLRRRAEEMQEAGVWTAVGSAKLDRGELTAALDCFRRAVGIDATYAPAHYQIGRTLLKLGRTDAAAAAFSRARELNPSLAPPGGDW
jgi:tetratricopeptide (TPR) repeat protein